MKELMQRIAVFLYHVIDAPESAPETVETAREALLPDVADAINGNYEEEESETPDDENG